ncbi:hypothetical protein BOX15_Mlig006490g3 [Macrostomum lignano]|uniref:G-protein coupled receptors family 1 profile domain-containing protein n=1 Tax=Macrostomum lignano TaxID=282301 RepID=A0A267EM72_9PLAT|nr:hypothetical protein BOX15_Mlig006490g1 [Macrostomum lignano]PAA74025.1 hypothetical protein BOX15_Mlig006490g3 [Macrostomum lignano]
MREPYLADFLWHRYQLLRAPIDSVNSVRSKEDSSNDSSLDNNRELCSPHILGNGTYNSAIDSRRAISEFDYWLRYGCVSWLFPLMWLVAVVGITVTLVTVRKHPKVIPSTTRVLLVSLFIVDALVLSIVGLRWWSYTVFGADFRNSYALLSAVFNYANYLLVHLSGWLQAFIFVERMLVVRDPMLAKTYLRRGRAKLCIAILLGTLALLNLPVAFLTYNFAESSVAADSTVRLMCSEWAYIGLKVVGLADLLVGSVLPLLIMLTGTVVISGALLSHKEMLAGSRSTPSPQALAASAVANDSRVHSSGKRRKRQQRICVVSLAMNGLYLVTNYPLTVVLLYTTFSRQSGFPPTFSAFTILYLVSLINNASNWALLTLTGRGYRKKLASVLKCHGNGVGGGAGTGCCYQLQHPYPTVQLARRRMNTRGSSASAMVILPN